MKIKILLKIPAKTLIVSAFAILIASCGGDDSVPAVSSVTFDKSTIVLAVGDIDTIIATVLPDDADKAMTWNSSATTIVTVDDNGAVTAIAIGSAVISASTANGVTATCNVTVEPSIYVAGHENDVATIWKNGKVLYRLSDTTKHSCARSVFISDNDVYVAGYERSVEDVGNDGLKLVGPVAARIWKNGVAQEIDNNADGDIAYSVYVSDGDVYVAGGRYIPSRYIATIWKNGVVQELNDSTSNAEARSVFVSGNDVYIAGYESSKPVLWKNGESHPLSDGSDLSRAYSVYVSGSDVYVAGYERNDSHISIGKVWKNGSASSMAFPGKIEPWTEIYSVFVSGNDVYTAGYELLNDVRTARLWKNGKVSTPFEISARYTVAESVFVFDNDVYVAGHDNENAKIWKNGVAYALTDGVHKSEAYSIFVK
jgi:hypothetical protein